MALFQKNFGLDSEEVFRDYMKTESYYETAKNFTDGRFQPTHQTIKNNVWKWACLNPEKSYEIVKDFLRQTGNEISEEMWERELVWNSRYGLGTSAREKFLSVGNRREVLTKMANKELPRFGYGIHATTRSLITPK